MSAMTFTSLGSSAVWLLSVTTSNVCPSSAMRKSAGPPWSPCGDGAPPRGSPLMIASLGRSSREAEAISLVTSYSRKRSRDGSSIGTALTVSACVAVSPR